MANKIKLIIGEEEYETTSRFIEGDSAWIQGIKDWKYVKINSINVIRSKIFGNNWPDDETDFDLRVEVEYKIFDKDRFVLVKEYELKTLDEVQEILEKELQDKIDYMKKWESR